MAQPANTGLAQRLMQQSDIFFAAVIIVVVGMMIIPLPTFFLDLFLTFNITFSLLVLLIAMNTLKPLEFSVFPALLLVATLFRLALNVSTTRWILLEAFAGQVVLAFGDFVVGANLVVGIIVFLILVLIQFIVITRGAERVAEVAARFTLDAMPGKQMSIDADLNAGLINEDEARSKREEIRREADFYGAMDGATKFVKGDAIAAIVITLINIVGGLVVGIMQQGMEWQEALQTYTLLTVGDGLVSQIPALLLSTAAGIIVTRAASENNMGQDVARQLLSQPRVLGVAAVLLLGLALVPGLPFIPFVTLAGLVGFAAYSLQQAARMVPAADAEEEEMKAGPAEEAPGGPEDVTPLLQVDPMEVELGYALVPLADPQQGGDLLDRIVLIRRQLALDLGFVLPTVRVRDNMQLAPNEYTIRLRGYPIGQGELLPGHLLSMRPEEEEAEEPGVEGIPTTEPTFGLAALWVPEESRVEAEAANYTVVEPAAVLATHLTELARQHSHELLGRQETRELLDRVRENNPALVDELVPNVLGLGQIQKVLANLLREKVSIRDLVTILETLSDYAPMTRDTDLLTEYVRQALARQVSGSHQTPGGVLAVITLSAEVEDTVRSSLQQTDHGNFLALKPRQAENLVSSISQQLQEARQRGYEPVLLTAPVVRFYLRRLIERQLPYVPVLSYNEVEADMDVQAVGRIDKV